MSFLKKIMIMIVVFVSLPNYGWTKPLFGTDTSGGGDSYLAVTCSTKDKKIFLEGDVGISCSHEVKIFGSIQETMTQTCVDSNVKFIYIEAAREAGKVVISGEKGPTSFNLISDGIISFKSKIGDTHEYFNFVGELTYLTWIDGVRTATVYKDVDCAGHAFSQP
ncbi:MAG: hypothetical protein H6623_08250 [Bdellovibrionaceae bacterium]|nr:hypothetical protein [Pseudobdellovibrionaceae bacterium]